MTAKKNPKSDDDWARAKKLCRLSVEDVRMAKALGMSPKSLIQHRDFELYEGVLAAGNIEVLYDADIDGDGEEIPF